MGTTLKFSPSFHPQTDGQSEEANSTVLDLLKCCVSEHKATWEHYLPLVEYAYNNTVHTSTGKAPFEIMEGGKKVPPILHTKEKIFEADNTVEDEILVEPVDAPEILDDFEFEEVDSQDIKDREIQTLNAPREGKKLLVLDIDYTLFDHRSSAENPHELMRPYLHEFLAAAYTEYDIVIWSATSMKWVEVKMKELGVLNNPNYKITALLDLMAMISVQSQSHGVFDCKPLGLLWGKFPEFYNPGNTIMFDDLKRNFVMNPQNGLVIRPFRKAHLNRGTDQELVGLSLYLLAIADLDNFQSLDHSRWEKFVQRNTKRRTS
ncbi:hypothetical protein L7F22_068511 [Adiantum nelumboides]|nr:hypothetical protein [Adiantum nelumboides]